MNDSHEDEPALLQVSRCDLYCLFSPVIQNLRTISSSGLAPRILRSLQRSTTSVKAHLKHLSQCNMTLSQLKKNTEVKFLLVLF